MGRLSLTGRRGAQRQILAEVRVRLELRTVMMQAGPEPDVDGKPEQRDRQNRDEARHDLSAERRRAPWPAGLVERELIIGRVHPDRATARQRNRGFHGRGGRRCGHPDVPVPELAPVSDSVTSRFALATALAITPWVCSLRRRSHQRPPKNPPTRMNTSRSCGHGVAHIPAPRETAAGTGRVTGRPRTSVGTTLTFAVSGPAGNTPDR